MAKIIDGKKISQEVKDECRERIAREGLNLTLAVVQVGNDPASSVYVGNKKRACGDVGIQAQAYGLADEATRVELLALVDHLN